ncbi:type II toxin-antitoxin system RelE/ParE family toxin [Marinoscillum furvescens]|uniref:Plasmid stabilization system protein ParE n=1 Tax=Marinoscillum furvescens DSM 4134 TaxID=1122208 RepID=A0A3D9L8H6_MARFU|nr:type II toxin-antitoxin system RelE/ParE family toxin [Marinoscillum furvescens]REE01586.1 plasmid stabilization system protein ParE [Marinoscillum furvescens DSM 4134]
MALNVIWTEEAKNSLSDIILYLEENWTEREIRKFFVRLEECVELIALNPQRAKDSLRKPNTKEFQHSVNTTIFYQYDEVNVVILKVWANAQNPDSL